MSYLVLARKYRPNLFNEMIGQDHITRTLTNAIANNRVHHAYLFSGIRGSGKTTVARILARALVCENGPTPTPCNQCEHCKAILEGRSVDVREIDGASNNSVDDIRNLREQVQYLPQSARKKIYIIDEVHMLSNSAFNALLKTLEEPPPHVTFIFATTDPQKVLGTILSRVSRLDFRRVSMEQIILHLRDVLEKEGVTATDEGLYLIASCTDGSVRDALTLLDKVLAFSSDCTQLPTEEIQTILGISDPQSTRKLVRSMLAQNASEALQVLQSVAMDSNNLQQFAVSVLQTLRDLAVVLATGETQSLIGTNESQREFLEQLSKSSNLAQVGQIFDRFSRVVDQMDRSRVPRLLLEMIVLEIVHTPAAIPISAMIERLETLSKTTPSNTPPKSSASSSPPSSPPPLSSKGRQETSSNASQSGPASLPVHTAPSPSGSQAAPSPTDFRKSEDAPANSLSVKSEFETHLWQMVQQSDRATTTSVQSPPSASNQNAVNKAPIELSHSSLETHVASSRQGLPQEQPTSNSRTLKTRSPSPSNVDPSVQDYSAGDETLLLTTKSYLSDNNSSHPPPNWTELPAFEQWEAFLNSIRSSDDLLFAVLAQSGLVQFNSSILELALPKSGIAAHQIETGTELRTRLQTGLNSYFGIQPKIIFLDRLPSVEEEIPSLRQIEAVRERKLQEDREREAREHPQIRALISSFSAKLGPVTPVSPS